MKSVVTQTYCSERDPIVRNSRKLGTALENELEVAEIT